MPDKLPVKDVVVLLPGILGSVLEHDGKEVWAISKGAAWRGLVTLGRSVKQLELDHDDPAAPDLGDGVRATRLMPDLHLVPGLWKIDGYGKVKERLFEAFEFVDGLNWHDFPYDWRRDNRAAAVRLAGVAEGWLDAYRAQGHPDAKLVLLGHSLGGLVARHYLEVLGGWKHTRALVTFGTPYRGSLNAVDFLAHGFRKGFGPFKLDLSKMLRSLTSVHQLLPTYRCIDDGTGEDRRIAEAVGLPAVFDPAKLAAAAAFHKEIADAVDANGGKGRYQIVPVVGVFQQTRSKAKVRDGVVEISFDENGGDGTVPRVSATPLELSDDGREMYATEAHASLQNFDAVITQVSGILTWESLEAYKGTPADGFQVVVEDVVPPGEGIEVTLATAGPVLNVEVSAENVDTGTTVAVTGTLGSDGRATVTLPALAPGVYRITGRDADGVGLKPVHELIVVADDASADLEAELAEPATAPRAKAATAATDDDTDVFEPPEGHDCPEGDEDVIPKGDTSAASRGWGSGWPTDNSAKTTVVRAGGISLRVHKDIAAIVERLVAETVTRGYSLRSGECWGFANRAIRGTQKPSNHSWGLAIDLNAPANPMGPTLVTDMPGWMVELWKSKKFGWGGDYRSRKDAMHFEFMGTPADASRIAVEVGGQAPADASPANAPAANPVLRLNAEGPAVRHLQERLNATGAGLSADGVFGPKTERAVKAFQSGHGLTADGIVGPRTWAALG